MSGQVVNASNNQFKLPKLASGIYLLSIVADGELVHKQKLAIE
jgi:hypothetical protein